MVSIPTSNHTFLFTDIEGNTQRWEQNPEAIQAALVRRDTIFAPLLTFANIFVPSDAQERENATDEQT